MNEKIFLQLNIIILISLLIKTKTKKEIKISLKPKIITETDLIFLQKSFLKPTNQKIKNQFKEKLNKKLTEYSGKILIGNPIQEFEFLFDTGSANIIVTSNLCLNEACENKKKFNSSISKTYKEIFHIDNFVNDLIRNPIERDKIYINFGTGQIKNYLSYENICLENKVLCVNQIILLEAYELSTIPFSQVSFDGIIGLSFTYLSINKQGNFIEMLFEQNRIDKKLFSFYFNINDNKSSSLNIGNIDYNNFIGEINWNDVISENYWEIKIDYIKYDNEIIINCEDNINECSAIIDTGTSMIASPNEIYDILDKKLQVDMFCNNINELKNLIFKINGVEFILEPDFYILKIPGEFNNNDNCLSAIMNINSMSSGNKQTFILGLPFLKKYYSIFDRDNKKIGFAFAKHT